MHINMSCLVYYNHFYQAKKKKRKQEAQAGMLCVNKVQISSDKKIKKKHNVWHRIY